MSTTENLGTASNITMQPVVSTAVVAGQGSPAPLSNVIPLFTTAFSIAMAILTISLSIFKPLLILSPVPILLYIFAPVIVFLDAVTTLLIRLPYRTFLYFTDAVFPLYVLCGVACITGGLFGLGARFLCRVLVKLISENSSLGAAREREQKESRGKIKRERVAFE